MKRHFCWVMAACLGLVVGGLVGCGDHGAAPRDMPWVGPGPGKEAAEKWEKAQRGVVPARETFALAPGHGMGFLRAKGSDIVNEKGEVVLLKGVGLGNWMLPEGYMWHFGEQGDRPRRIEKVVSDLIGEEDAGAFWKAYWAGYVTEKDIARIAELGFNSVRPAMDARLFLTEGDDPQFRAEGFLLLDRLINWCKARGVYVILDMHAAPGGQTGLNIDDSVDDEPRLFMGDKKYEERLTALWVKLADRYKDEPAVGMYDLLNEPLPKRTGAEEKYKDLLEPMYERLTAAIREVDQRHIVTVEGSNFANNLTIFGKKFDDNVVYQFHYYCRANPTEVKPMASYLEPGRKLGGPLWVGETGERDGGIYWATTEWMEADGIGWSFWPWKKMGAENGLCSVKLPADWGIISRMAEGDARAVRPSKAEAKRVLWELLKNIKLENCTYNEEVGNSLMRRAPVRVEGEDYGRGGMGVSYFVKDEKKMSGLYRKLEPVQVEAVSGGGRRSGQAIHLQAGEWTAYGVNSLEERDFALTVRVKRGSAEGCSFRVSVNGANAEGSQRTALIGGEWLTLKMNAVRLKKGGNVVRVTDMSGEVVLDWMDLR